MKKFILLMIVLFNLLTVAQDTQLFYQHEVPTYSYKSLYFEADNLLGYFRQRYGTNSSESFSSNASLVFTFENQSPVLSRGLTVYANHNYYKDQRFAHSGYKIEFANFKLISDVKNHTYFSKKTWFLATDAKFLFENANRTSTNNGYIDQTSGYLGLFLGGGYGRVVNTRSVAKAHMLATELALNLSNESLNSLSEIIERYDNGVYNETYKDDSKIKFFEDIHGVIGSSTNDLKIEQILNSALYKIIDRKYGSRIMAGLKANVHQANGASFPYYQGTPKELNLNSDLFLAAEFAMPIAWDKQFSVGLGYTKNLQDREFRSSLFETDLSFNIEHKYNWASSLTVGFAQAYFEDIVEKSNFFATVSTQMAIINQLVLSAYAQYYFHSFVDYSSNIMPTYTALETEQESTMISLGLKYYIF